MKLLAFCLFVLVNAVSAQIDSSKIPQLSPHYIDEYHSDKSINNTEWSKQKSGLNISFATTNHSFFNNEVPEKSQLSSNWEVNAWKGERINTFLLLWSNDTINQIRIIFTDLKKNSQASINSNVFSAKIVRNVLSNYPYNASDVTCGAGPTDKAYEIPDRLEPFERFNLMPNYLRATWLSIDLPQNIEAGIYTGQIEVKSLKSTSFLNVKINIQNNILPPPSDWKFRLDIWQNPWVLAKYYNVKPWGEEHKALLKKHLKIYADCGGKYITTYAVFSPWAETTYHLDDSMVAWIKQKNGKWKFDYAIFDQYVHLAHEVGISKAITIYTPIPWGERFRYLDEATGNYVFERWLPTSEVFKKNWNTFLTDLEKHLKQKGWFSKTFLGINENEMTQTISAIKVIKAHNKDWKITYAGDWHTELDSLLDDFSSVYPKEPNLKEVQNRTLQKRFSTFYVCCTPPKPNTFVFSPPVEGRWLGIYAFAHGYDGFLRWAYDSWGADPNRDARFVVWGAGDSFMVYPGGNNSIRFEKLREGIIDYEKMRILKNKFKSTSNPETTALLEKLELQLSIFNQEKDFKTEQLIDEVKGISDLINQLSDK